VLGEINAACTHVQSLGALGVRSGMVVVTTRMAAGGLLNAKRVADTLINGDGGGRKLMSTVDRNRQEKVFSRFSAVGGVFGRGVRKA
jgi:hypothetical protein